MQGNGVLSWLHIGDLHVAGAGDRALEDLRRIVTLANGVAPGSLDFVLLPGDNADDGTATQFRLVAEAVAPLRLPLHILPGDHDFGPRSLDAFHDGLGTARLPYAIRVQGRACLFLDVVSAGTGGPDFRLGDDQLGWLEAELEQAEAGGMEAVVFMHGYPADLRDGAERLGALLARPHVLCVDMGHTHYNELANDGGTVFMATRSTGQIEEGPVGFSIAAVDGRCVSWRFKPLDAAWPCVLITRPADRRLFTGAFRDAAGPFEVRAKGIGDVPLVAMDMRAGDGDWTPMLPVPGVPALWTASCSPASGTTLQVRARDADGREDKDRIERVSAGWRPPDRAADGSDRDRVGAWPEKSILGTQLGPNRNGRAW